MDYTSLIVKFLSKDVTEAEAEALKAWLEEDPSHRILFDRANSLWQGSPANANNFDTESAWKDLGAQLEIGHQGSSKVVVLNKFRYRNIIAAASVALIMALGGLLFLLTDRSTTRAILDASTTIRTEEGEKAGIFLADSTYVLLNSGSSLAYNSDYNLGHRKVSLKGEAYFDVSTDAGKPFTVQLGKITVSALGTKFNILSYDNENRVETTLEEGMIKVVAGSESIDLRPGQQLVYYNNTGKAEVKDVTTEIYTSWKENKLRLIDTPLEEALRRIARRYNVTFEIRNRDILDLKYTATFIDESIDEVMEMLKTVSPIEYHIYNRMTVDERKYLKPRIIIEKRTQKI